jgi:hypothetical protein
MNDQGQHCTAESEANRTKVLMKASMHELINEFGEPAIDFIRSL